jgi:alpha-1,6-mannosyltransferase
MQAATGSPRARAQAQTGPNGGRGALAGARAALAPGRLQALGWLGLAGVPASLFMLAAGAAARPTALVPARSGGWPDWLSGPLHGLDIAIGRGGFQTYTLVLCASYLAVLACARGLPLRAICAAILAAHVIVVLGPPLISQDVFGYLGYARLGALHGLDPYTHLTAEAPTDPVFPFLGWPFKHSPYGPLFTLASYATAPLGVAGALWTFKALAVLCSLASVALIARASARLGGSAAWSAAFVGLNPVLLELAVGGAHNDTLLMLALAAALALTAGAEPRLRSGVSALVAGIGIKVSAGLSLLFLLLAPARGSERLRLAASAAVSFALLAIVALAGFGSHALGFLGAIGEQQQLVASHSIPAETARLVGLSGTPTWWRQLFGAAFVLALVYALWRTARGADWRTAAGWATLALLSSTAWLLPWYAIWALPLAAVSGDRRLRAATLVVCAYAILIHLPLADPLLSPKS